MHGFGKRLKQLRTETGMTQAELAEQLGVTKSVVSYYESTARAPSTGILVRMAQIFHVTTDYLLGLDERIPLDTAGLDESDLRLLRLTVEALRNKGQK